MSERNRLLSVVGERAFKYAFLKKPSEIIPFKGDFPLLPSFKMEEFSNLIKEKQYVEEAPMEYQIAIARGNKIAVLELGFKTYLQDNGISIEDFKKLENNQKSDFLIKWMDENCVGIKQLNIN